MDVRSDKDFFGDKNRVAGMALHHSDLTITSSNHYNSMSDTESEFEGFDVQPLSDIELEGFDTDSDEEPLPIQDNHPQTWFHQISADYNIGRFTQEVGPAHQLPATSRELDFFNVLFPPYLYQQIAEETNRNAEEKQRRAGHADPKWTPVTPSEVAAFLGFNIYMGIVPKPGYKYHFSESTDDDYADNVGLRYFGSRLRFEKIDQYFHVGNSRDNPPKGQPGHDVLSHIRHVLTVINERCRSAYKPHRETSVDEAMVGYKGRLSWRQYCPMKPKKHGIKVWVRADPHNGYVNELQVYTGKEEGVPEKGLGARVVKDLTRHLVGTNHIVYCDNFFSSPALFNDLLEDDIYAVGTVRTNRKGYPQDLAKVKLKQQGQSAVRQSGQLVATTWKDKKQVFFLSTGALPGVETSVLRQQKSGIRQEVPCPEVVYDYGKYMSGVDRADQLRESYPAGKKAVSWWRYLFWFLFDVAAVNAYILMRESPSHQRQTRQGRGVNLRQLNFRKTLSRQLMMKNRPNVQASRKRPAPDNEGMEQQPARQPHWPVEAAKRGRCRRCTAAHGRRREILSRCIGCGTDSKGRFIYLCVPCFMPWHTEQEG